MLTDIIKSEINFSSKLYFKSRDCHMTNDSNLMTHSNGKPPTTSCLIEKQKAISEFSHPIQALARRKTACKTALRSTFPTCYHDITKCAGYHKLYTTLKTSNINNGVSTGTNFVKKNVAFYEQERS